MGIIFVLQDKHITTVFVTSVMTEHYGNTLFVYTYCATYIWPVCNWQFSLISFTLNFRSNSLQVSKFVFDIILVRQSSAVTVWSLNLCSM